MANKLGDYEHNKAILRSLDKALEEGPWQQSKLLGAMGKKLKDLRDSFSQTVSFQQQEQADKLAAASEQRIGSTETTHAYISLYCSDGNNIQRWERILSTIGQAVITRPIYKSEQDAAKWVRSRINPTNEGYAIIELYKADIQGSAEALASTDKLGNPVITMKGTLSHQPKIHRFVHKSGVYDYQDGRLVRQDDVESEL